MPTEMRPERTEELDYESLDWEDVHLSNWAMSLFRESSAVLRYLPD